MPTHAWKCLLPLSLVGLLPTQDAIASAPEVGGGAVGAETTPTNESRWFARIGPVVVPYHSSARIAVGGEVIPGATAHARSNVTVIFDVGYDITDDFAVLLMGGIPPRTAVDGRGTVGLLGNLGAVRYGPMFLTGIYRFPQWHGLRPYAGGGMAGAFILSNFDGAVSRLDVHDNSGIAVQAGLEYRWNEKWETFADYKHLWLYLNADGLLGNAPVKARITLNPDVISVGVKVHF